MWMNKLGNQWILRKKLEWTQNPKPSFLCTYAILTSHSFYIYIYIYMLYHNKEEIHSEIELTIYWLKWYSPTSIVSLTRLVLHTRLVLLMIKIFQYWSCLRTTSFILLRYQKSCGMSHYTIIYIIYIYIYIYIYILIHTHTQGYSKSSKPQPKTWA